MFPGSLRTRLALLYGGVFLVLALVVLSIPFLAVSESVHVGSTAPPVVQHPGRSLLPTVSVVGVARARLAAGRPPAPAAAGDRRDRTGHLRHQPEPPAADQRPRR
jgi:hypothetical protein